MAKKKSKTKARTIAVKAGVVRIPSNGLETQQEGWVEMHAYLKKVHIPYFQGLDFGAIQKAIDEEASPFGEDYEDVVKRKQQAMGVIDRLLSAFVLDWNWTYPDGVSYQSPHNNIDAFEEIDLDEFEWLFDQMAKIVTEEDIVIPKSSGTPS